MHRCREYAVPGTSYCVEHTLTNAQRWAKGQTGKRGSRPGWRKLRRQVYDEQRGLCRQCLQHMRLDDYEVHHRDGNAKNDARSNLEAVHPLCHRKL